MESQNSQSLTGKLISSAFWSFTTRNSFFVVNFIGQLVLVRFLEPEAFGTIAFALAISGILLPVISLSIPMGFIKSDGTQADFDSAILLAGVVAGLIAFVAVSGLIILSVTTSLIAGQIFAVVSASQIPLIFANLHLAPLERSLNFRNSSLIKGVGSLGGIGVAVGFAVFTDIGVWALALRELTVGLTVLVLGLFVAPLRFRFSPSLSLVRQLVRFGFKMAVVTIGESLFSRLPVLGVQSQLGSTVLGFYDRAFFVTSLPTRALVPVSESVSFAFYSRVSDAKERVTVGLYWSYFLISRGVTPLAIILILDAERVVTLLYGEDWLEAAGFARALSVYSVVFPVYSIAKSSAYAMGRQVWVAQGFLIGLATVVAGIGLSVTIENSLIIAWSMSVGAVLMSMYVFARFSLDGIRPQWGRLVIPNVVLAAGAILVGDYFQDTSRWLGLVLALALWAVGTLILDWKRIRRLVRRGAA